MKQKKLPALCHYESCSTWSVKIRSERVNKPELEFYITFFKNWEKVRMFLSNTCDFFLDKIGVQNNQKWQILDF